MTGVASPALRAAVAAEPRHAPALTNLGLVLKAAHGAAGAAEAVGLYERARALDPGARGVALNLGAALFSLGRLAEAEAAYSAELALDPADADAQRSLEVVKRHMQRGAA